ncbi:putative dihydrodipicolinate protein [Gregarina niphandrodes]|uniref:Dihydrodipicolinate protein n=1 Tax=Gregarina niphandrodes TaxID=110365 RepID=A0A023AZ86_GRENI|nr:putative dihydrodipicolinate protein [Gregarina niphandrodes]EZG43635.1 putative dihydrodipicolinate protein [Gregarina niphandrodes]|eukprot:XP_011133138.1 putative dihydrodipicolinate protein [Gregarina niphandrodes]
MALTEGFHVPIGALNDGAFVPIPTFFADGGLDFGTLEKHLGRLCSTKVVGVALMTYYGEGVHVTASERRAYIAHAAAYVKGRHSKAQVLVVASAESTHACAENCKEAKSLGADAALVAPPSVYTSLLGCDDEDDTPWPHAIRHSNGGGVRLTEQECVLFDFYCELARLSPIPIVIDCSEYGVPRTTLVADNAGRPGSGEGWSSASPIVHPSLLYLLQQQPKIIGFATSSHIQDFPNCTFTNCSFTVLLTNVAALMHMKKRKYPEPSQNTSPRSALQRDMNAQSDTPPVSLDTSSPPSCRVASMITLSNICPSIIRHLVPETIRVVQVGQEPNKMGTSETEVLPLFESLETSPMEQAPERKPIIGERKPDPCPEKCSEPSCGDPYPPVDQSSAVAEAGTPKVWLEETDPADPIALAELENKILQLSLFKATLCQILGYSAAAPAAPMKTAKHESVAKTVELLTPIYDIETRVASRPSSPLQS